MRAPYAHLTTPGGIFSLVKDGHADSRADLARLTGLAPSTIALRIDTLMQHGFLEESGEGKSRGGRKPRRLRPANDGRVVASVDLSLGTQNIALHSLTGERLSSHSTRIPLHQAPETVLEQVFQSITSRIAEQPSPPELVGIGLAIPGPVSNPGGRLISPSRMPGWHGADPGEILARITSVPVVSENDANAMAWGEFLASGREDPDMIVVKADSSIGMGIITEGRLYRGARGLAGDVSHTIIAGAPQVLCSCGRLGCLDVLAGGHSIVESLREDHPEVTDLPTAITLATDGHPHATRLLRESGLRTGAVLATLVSFANPGRVALAGDLAASEAFVAGVRSSIYDLCLPLSTNGLELGESRQGPHLATDGVAALVMDRLLSPAHIDATLGL